MTYFINRRWGGAEREPGAERLREILNDLDAGDDEEHVDVSLTHESEWTISVFTNGTVVFENVETGEGPWHLLRLPSDEVLQLWLLLAQGDLDSIRQYPWIDGYSL